MFKKMTRGRDAKTKGKKKFPSKGKRFVRKKVCLFCKGKAGIINYKDAEKLRRFTSERGKIMPSRVTGNCAKHQRQLAAAIKRARIIALLPFVSK